MAAMSAWRLTISSALVGDALLLVDELATNSVIQSPSGFEIELAFDAGRDVVTVEVRDRCQDTPFVTGFQDGRSHISAGLVDALATEWGYSHGRDGARTVWATIER